jgi:NAD(P)-dependent dehydrogenase (short-subunit alcohol dehydrogenase family)
MLLTSKVAIVTGGAMGIGFAVAKDLAARGVSLVIADIVDATAAITRLREQGYQTIGLKVDVSCVEDTNAMAAAAVAEFGGIDIWSTTRASTPLSSLAPSRTSIQRSGDASWR